MKKIVFLAMVCFTVCLFCSCGSAKYSYCSRQEFTVQGEPGTIIKTPFGERLAVIDKSGRAEITLSYAGGYTPYLCAQAPNSKEDVLFALDFNETKKAQIRVAVLSTSSLVVMIGAIAGGVFLCIDGMIPLGIATMAGGITAGVEMMRQIITIPNECLYEYLPEQSTNNDLIKR